YTPVVTDKGDGTFTVKYSGMPKYASGKEVTYSVKEDGIDGYATQADTAANGGTITNKHTPATVDISGSKTWEDNDDQDGARPQSITIRLLANGTEKASKTVTAADEWKWSFTGLDKYSAGKEITYTITEDAVSGYSTAVNGYDVANTHTPGKTSLTVTKAWDDADNRDSIRPASVTVTLMADGAKAEVTDAEVTLNEANHWTYTWSGLDEKKDGKAITYTVEETAVEGYTAAVSGDAKAGYTITNTHKPTETPTPTPTETPTPTPTETPTPTPTAEPTPEPTAEPTPDPTAEPTPEPTAEPTPEPQPEPEPEPADTRRTDSLFYDTAVRYIDYNDLAGRSREEVRLICNEIYARHGYIFSNQAYNDYFSQFAWYSPSVTKDGFSEDMFNQYERENVHTIAHYEKDMGWR
ncbi:MAG: Cna B-type domain-containing protein, partial [Lachnospiraceae bacterium]|nr:Cna B-type domain-containing protein [Lachnospiraceae bacterium]